MSSLEEWFDAAKAVETATKVSINAVKLSVASANAVLGMVNAWTAVTEEAYGKEAAGALAEAAGKRFADNNIKPFLEKKFGKADDDGFRNLFDGL